MYKFLAFFFPSIRKLIDENEKRKELMKLKEEQYQEKYTHIQNFDRTQKEFRTNIGGIFHDSDELKWFIYSYVLDTQDEIARKPQFADKMVYKLIAIKDLIQALQIMEKEYCDGLSIPQTKE